MAAQRAKEIAELESKGEPVPDWLRNETYR